MEHNPFCWVRTHFYHDACTYSSNRFCDRRVVETWTLNGECRFPSQAGRTTATFRKAELVEKHSPHLLTVQSSVLSGQPRRSDRGAESFQDTWELSVCLRRIRVTCAVVRLQHENVASTQQFLVVGVLISWLDVWWRKAQSNDQRKNLQGALQKHVGTKMGSLIVTWAAFSHRKLNSTF